MDERSRSSQNERRAFPGHGSCLIASFLPAAVVTALLPTISGSRDSEPVWEIVVIVICTLSILHIRRYAGGIWPMLAFLIIPVFVLFCAGALYGEYVRVGYRVLNAGG